jgi:hypothetical protein
MLGDASLNIKYSKSCCFSGGTTTAGCALSCQSIHHYNPILTVIFPALVVIIKYTCLVTFSCNTKHCPRLVSSPILLYKIDICPRLVSSPILLYKIDICPRLVSSPILLYKVDLVCGDTNQGQNSSTINKGYPLLRICNPK